MSAYSQVPPEVIAAMAKDNKSPMIIGIVIAFTALAFVFVCLRFISRAKFVGLVGMEDYFIVFSMVFSILSSVCLVQQARYGNGKHLINIPFENVKNLLRYLFFSIIAYHITLTSTKLSILLQYRRIFTLKESRIPIYIVMALCLACGITAVFCAIFTCIPVDAYWNLPKKAFAKCINQDAMYHANAGLNIATDLMVAALPVRSLWALRIPKRQKVVLLLVLTLGWFVCIISVIRLYFLVLVAKHQDDQTWYSGPAAYWSAMEVNLAIVCASTPALKPLVVRFVPRFGTKATRKQSYDHSARSTNPQDLKNSGKFVRLNGKPSQSSMGDDIVLEQGITALPAAHKPGQWSQIHVTRDFEQRSTNETRLSDDSQKDLYIGAPRRARW